MPGRVGEDQAVLGVGLHVAARGPGCEHACLGGGQVVDEEVEVHQRRVVGPRGDE